MAVFSPNSLPEGVKEGDLYDGPKVVPLASGRGAFLDPQSDAPAAANAAAQALTHPIASQVTAARPMGELPSNSPPPLPASTAEVKSAYPAAIELALDVLSARLLGVIALVTACLIWAGIIYDPQFWRIIAGGVFSMLVFLPIMVIYWRAGMRGEGG